MKEFLRPAIIFNPPGGLPVADQTGAWGFMGLAQNANNYAEQLSSAATAGTAFTLVVPSNPLANPAGNVLAGFTQLNAGATGGLTATMPSTSSIIAALGNALPLDGTYTQPFHLVNNCGQTVTLAAGDSNATIMGSSTIAAGNVRKYLMRVMNSANLSVTNVGTWTL